MKGFVQRFTIEDLEDGFLGEEANGYGYDKIKRAEKFTRKKDPPVDSVPGTGWSPRSLFLPIAGHEASANNKSHGVTGSVYKVGERVLQGLLLGAIHADSSM